MKFNFSFDIGKIEKKLQTASEQSQIVLDSIVLRDSNYYAPMDQNNLIESAIRNSRPGSGEVIWDTIYARRLYYNPQYDFRTDKNPNAGGLWFERAKADRIDEWVKALNYVFKSEV